MLRSYKNLFLFKIILDFMRKVKYNIITVKNKNTNTKGKVITMTNIVIETGRLTADPELRYTGETPLCKFRIAVDRPKRKGEDKPETDFFNCTAWNHNAEFISDMFSKGEMITVVGNLRSSIFEKNGEKRSAVEIKVNEVHFPGYRRKQENNSTADGGSTYDGDVLF